MQSYKFFSNKVNYQINQRASLKSHSDLSLPVRDYYLEVYLNSDRPQNVLFNIPSTASSADLLSLTKDLISGYVLKLAFNQIWLARTDCARATRKLLLTRSSRHILVSNLDEFEVFRQMSSSKNLSYLIELTSNHYVVGIIKKDTVKIKLNSMLNQSINLSVVKKNRSSIPLAEILKTHQIFLFDIPDDRN